MGRVGDRLPDFLRRVAKLADDDELPVFGFAFVDLHTGGRTRRVFVASVHLVTDFPFVRVGRRAHHFASCVSWTMLPQVSFNIAMVEPVTSVGGMVNSAPFDLTRS